MNNNQCPRCNGYIIDIPKQVVGLGNFRFIHICPDRIKNAANDEKVNDEKV